MGGIFSNITESEAPLSSPVNDTAVLGVTIFSVDAPALCCRRDQHFSCGRSHGSHEFKEAGCAFTVTGKLPVNSRITICWCDCRELDHHTTPVSAQFFGEHRRKRSHDALAHLRLRRYERHLV